MLVDQAVSSSASSPAPASPPPAADLLELARSTDQDIAGAAPGAAAAAAAEPKLPLEQELAGMFAMIGAGAGHWLPSVGRVLDEAACKSLGDVLAPVAHKYGLAKYLEGFAWRVELQALMVAVPIGLAIKAAAVHDLAAIAAKQRDAAAGSSAVFASSSPAPNLTGQELADTRGMLQPIDTVTSSSAPVPAFNLEGAAP